MSKLTEKHREQVKQMLKDMKTEPNTIRERLIKIGEKMGLNQAGLAREFNVTPAAVSLWISGDRSLPGPMFRMLDLYESHLNIEETPATCIAKPNIYLDGVTISSIPNQPIIQSARNALEKPPERLLPKVVETLGYHFNKSSYDAKSWQEVEKQLSKSFVFYQRLLPSISKTPISVGLNSQVHLGTTCDDISVALKINLYNEQEKTLPNIFKQFKNGDELQKEIENRISAGTDLTLEEKNLKKFQGCLQNVTGIKVPKLYPELSDSRILCMEAVEGESFTSFASRSLQTTKDHIGGLLYYTIFRTLFKHGISSTTFLPDNILVNGNELVLLDFKFLADMDPEFLNSVIAIMKASQNMDFAIIDHEIKKMGFEIQENDYLQFRQLILEIIQALWPKNGRTFIKKHIKNLVKKINSFSTEKPIKAPKEALKMIAPIIGVFSLIGNLEATANWENIINQAIEGIDYAPGEAFLELP